MNGIKFLADTNCFIYLLDELVAFTAIKLKRSNNIKLPDAIIAASAQLMRLPLLTADKGFSNVKDIDCIILDL